jgi:tetrahydromethanopterin:alpha-L-glutamate ligase
MMKKLGVIGIPGGWSSERLADSLAAETGFRCLIDMKKVQLDLDTGRAFANGMCLNDLDGIIVKKISPVYSPNCLDRMEILSFLHETGIPVFSKPRSILGLIDRLSCTIRLRVGGIPMPSTVITEDMGEAFDAVERFGKAVFKPLYSSKARGMMVIETGVGARDGIHEFQAAGNPLMYIQKFLPRVDRDLGVVFLGGKYLATYARQKNGETWNTTTRSGGRYVPYEPASDIITLAEKAQGLFDMAFTCVDVVETEGGPFIYEVSAFGGFRGLLEANGLDAANAYARFVLDHLK